MQRVTGAMLMALGALFATHQLSKLSPSFTPATNCSGATACDAKIAATHTEINVEELPRGPALVEFISGHCSVCKKMHPLVIDLEQRCAQGLIVRVNVDEPNGRQLAAHYGVSMVPTFVSIDPSGGEVQRIIGEQSKERLILALNDLGGKPCEPGR